MPQGAPRLRILTLPTSRRACLEAPIEWHALAPCAMMARLAAGCAACAGAGWRLALRRATAPSEVASIGGTWRPRGGGNDGE